MRNFEFTRAPHDEPDSIWDDTLQERDRLVNLIFETYFSGEYTYICKCRSCNSLFGFKSTRLEKANQSCSECGSNNYEQVSSNVWDSIDENLKQKINNYLDSLRCLDLKYQSPNDVIWPTFPTI